MKIGPLGLPGLPLDKWEAIRLASGCRRLPPLAPGAPVPTTPLIRTLRRAYCAAQERAKSPSWAALCASEISLLGYQIEAEKAPKAEKARKAAKAERARKAAAVRAANALLWT